MINEEDFNLESGHYIVRGTVRYEMADGLAHRIKSMLLGEWPITNMVSSGDQVHSEMHMYIYTEEQLRNLLNQAWTEGFVMKDELKEEGSDDVL